MIPLSKANNIQLVRKSFALRSFLETLINMNLIVDFQSYSYVDDDGELMMSLYLFITREDYENYKVYPERWTK